VNDARFESLPGCLETPKSKDLHEDVENMAILRGMVEESSRTKPPKKKPAKKQSA
jgi:hypothetical protein